MKHQGKKTIGLALAQVLFIWGTFFQGGMTVEVAISGTLFSFAFMVNRFFTNEPISIPFVKKK